MTSLQSNLLQLSGATWLAEVPTAGSSFSNAAAGDVALRTTDKTIRVGTSTGKSAIDIAATTGVVTVNNILNANVGTLGPIFLVNFTGQTVAVNALMLLSEPGNPGYGTTTPLGNFQGVVPPEGGQWARMRFIVRACTSGTGMTGANMVMQIQQNNYQNAPPGNVGATFGGTDGGSGRGFQTWFSPWIAPYQDVPQFYIKNVGPTPLAIGPVYIQMG